MLRLLALPLLVVALHPQEPLIRPLPAPLQATLASGFWERGCPVPLSQLRLLTVPHWGFDGRAHVGQLVVNRSAAAPLAKVFRRLYALHFPIRHLELGDMYGPRGSRPADGDVTGSFECRQAVPSPCTGGSGTGTWSNHAYGLALDLNPAENPYLQWIMTGRHTTALPMSLRAEHFETIRRNLDKIEWHCCTIEEFFDRPGAERVDRYNLSDIFEYMSEENYCRLLDKLVCRARPGARLAYWNMLVPRSRPESMSDRLEPLADLSARLFIRDKAAFYSRFVVEQVRASL